MKTIKKQIATFSACLLLITSLAGCRGYNGDKVRQERADWMESLEDSIRTISEQRGRDSIRVIELQAKVAGEIGDFTTVANPREVEPYYILTDYKKDYPLKSTGIAARMMKNESIELIAALSGRKFNSIRVEADGKSAASDVVPADQALNYTANGLTTVAFSGVSADSICDFVQANQSQTLNLQFLQNGAVASTVKLSPAQISWITRTWSVSSAHKQARILEKKMMADTRKIEILKITLAEKKTDKEK